MIHTIVNMIRGSARFGERRSPRPAHSPVRHRDGHRMAKPAVATRATGPKGKAAGRIAGVASAPPAILATRLDAAAISVDQPTATDTPVTNHKGCELSSELYPAGCLYKVKKSEVNCPRVFSGQKAARASPIETDVLEGKKVAVRDVCVYTDNLQASLDFYVGGLGLEVDRFRTRNNGYKGAWLTIGKEERIHLIELRNSFKHEQRDEAGMNVDFAFAIPPGSVERLMARMDVHEIEFATSSWRRRAVAFSDPDGYKIEAVELVA